MPITSKKAGPSSEKVRCCLGDHLRFDGIASRARLASTECIRKLPGNLLFFRPTESGGRGELSGAMTGDQGSFARTTFFVIPLKMFHVDPPLFGSECFPRSGSAR